MASEDGLKTRGLQHAGLDELQQPGLVLGASGLERDGGQMFGGENPRGRAVHIPDHGFFQRLLHQRTGRRQELNRPARDDDVFTFNRATASGQIIVNALVG